MLRVSPGYSVTLGGNILDQATQLPKTAGTIYALLQLHRSGDADDGKYWDTDSGGSWQAAGSVVSWPTATYSRGTWWTYAVPVAATAKEGAVLKLVDLTDNVAVPAIQTVITGGCETAEVSPVSREILADLVESLRSSHTAYVRQAFYVDSYAGSDTTGDGTRGQPYATITKALSVTTNRDHTVIFLVPGDPTGTTVFDEQFNANKAYTFIRGPGRDVLVKSSLTGDIITISAEGVSLEKFRVETHTSGSGRAIVVDQGDFCLLRDLWVGKTRGHAISILGASFAQIISCWVHEAGQSGSGHGIVIDPTTAPVDHCHIANCHIADVEGSGIRAESGGALEELVVHHCEVLNSKEWGIELRNGSDAVIYNNILANNVSGPIDDQGTNTVQYNNTPYSTLTTDDLPPKLEGARAITLQVKDELGASVLGATVHIYNEGGTWMGEAIDRDQSGEVVIYRDDGTYGVVAVTSRFMQDTMPQPLVVTGDATVEVLGTWWVAPTPSAPNKCVLYVNIEAWTGKPADGAVVQIQPVLPSISGGKLRTGKIECKIADGDGYVALEGERLTTVKVTCEAAGWDAVVKTVPDAPNQDIATWDIP